MTSRTLQFGYIKKPTRYNSALIPVKSGRSLLTSFIGETGVNGNLPDTEETFIDEKEAVEETLEEQAGSGILDVIAQGAKALGTLGTAAAPVIIGAKVAKVTGKLIGDLAFGKVGTAISNKLSEKFNKNPNWRPGFPGEAHVVLNTPHGLTRANFCGPGTQIVKRVRRGDRGVNQIDTACEKHDLLYHFARTPEDIRRADNQMILDVDAVTDAGRAQKFLAKSVIQGKKLGEDVGLFGPETFTTLNLEGQGIADRMEGVQRHMGQIMARVMNLPHQSIHSRFGGNGITRGQIISGNDTMRHAVSGSGIRRSGLLGNVKGRDPTISGMNTSFISGTGNNALISILRNREPNPLSNRMNTISGRGLLPEETRDSTRRKFLDPTIRNEISSDGVTGIGGNAFNLDSMSPDSHNDNSLIRKSGSGLSLAGTGGRFPGGPFHTANPRGSGILDNIAAAAEGLREAAIERPGTILKKSVLNSLSKARKSKLDRTRRVNRKSSSSIRKSGRTASLAGGRKQKGGQLGILASIAGSILVPEIIKLFKKKKKKKKGQKGKGSGRMVYPYELRKISSGASGRGKKKLPASNLVIKLAKQHGLLPMSLSSNALIPLIQSAAKKQKLKKGQEGGQLGLLASLAASLILPKIIKVIRGK